MATQNPNVFTPMSDMEVGIRIEQLEAQFPSQAELQEATLPGEILEVSDEAAQKLTEDLNAHLDEIVSPEQKTELESSVPHRKPNAGHDMRASMK